MIKHAKIEGSNNRLSVELRFHKDLNIITGKNGSGKTTTLKLLWYLLSGNIEWAIKEINFENAEITTDKLKLTLRRNPLSVRKSVSGRDGKSQYEWEITCQLEGGQQFRRNIRAAEDPMEIGGRIAKLTGSSIFFPTFRRIEGGFSMSRMRDAPDNPT